MAAELRRHPAGEVSPVLPSQMEITLAVKGSRTSVVERRAGRAQRTPAHTGTLWFCPIGVQEEEIRISEPIPEVLHLYLPTQTFAALDDADGITAAPERIFYLADVEDALVRQICWRILQELAQETAGGRLVVQSLAQSLALHISTSYSSSASRSLTPVKGGLDPGRLSRVLEYIREHLDQDIEVAELARVACLSRHHFTRSFQQSLGVPPHRYVSALRLERAKALLEAGDIPLSQISLICQFSSQSAFGRAFTRSVGISPAEYRRLHRPPPRVRTAAKTP